MDRPVHTLFHPLIRQWFEDRFGTATEIQRRAWPEIARGRHVLVTAPTGSGKTLTAFLWAVNRLVVAGDRGDGGRILYISPLKALNNDIRRNLEEPLEELRALFDRAGEPFPGSGFQCEAVTRTRRSAGARSATPRRSSSPPRKA